MTNYMQLFVHDTLTTIVNEVTFIQEFLSILKLRITTRVMFSAGSTF